MQRLNRAILDLQGQLNRVRLVLANGVPEQERSEAAALVENLAVVVRHYCDRNRLGSHGGVAAVNAPAARDARASASLAS
jgi:hypothetical protein